MSDISTTSWSELDSGNNQQPPEGWPAGMNANGVEPCARMNMGAVKRFWDRINPTYAAALTTTDTYTLTPTVGPGGGTTYGTYERWRARFPSANTTTSPTLNISSIGAQPIQKYVNGAVVNVAAGDIQGQDHEVWHNGAVFILTNPVATAAGNAANANTGVAGHTLPYLDGNNTWSGTNTFTSNTIFGAATFSGPDTFNNTVTFTKTVISATVPLASPAGGGTVAIDLSTGNQFDLTVNGAITALTMVNGVAGQNGRVNFIYNTTSCPVSGVTSYFKLAGGAAWSTSNFSSVSGEVDMLSYDVRDAQHIHTAVNKNFA